MIAPKDRTPVWFAAFAEALARSILPPKFGPLTCLDGPIEAERAELSISVKFADMAQQGLEAHDARTAPERCYCHDHRNTLVYCPACTEAGCGSFHCYSPAYCETVKS